MFNFVFITLMLLPIFAVCLMHAVVYCCFYCSISVYLSINICEWPHFLITVGTLGVIASGRYEE